MLAWVYAAARACPLLDHVVIAVESPEVEALCCARGWPYRVTSPELRSGSDRLFAVAQEMDADIYVNLQADEPLLRTEHLEALIAPFSRPEVRVTTLKVRCPTESIGDPNVVKVVTDTQDRGLYFSRAAIPYQRDQTSGESDAPSAPYWKHLGLYAYRREALAQFAALPAGQLENMERLEQLRLLENGIPLHVAKVEHDTIGVDTEEDLRRVEALLSVTGRTFPL